MKKTFFLFFLITVILLFCSSCDVINGIIGGDGGDNTVCEHEWVEATCQSPRKCIKCDATFGGIGNHKYSEATCTLPEVCEFCGIWYGLAIGHDFLSQHVPTLERVKPVDTKAVLRFIIIPRQPVLSQKRVHCAAV